jgi:spore coat polysaccharide biosynthesis protein SpsF
MNVVAIVQARMGSSRLPGKVLLPLAGEPVLGHVVTRLRHCRRIQQVVVATTTECADDAIDQWCRQHQVACFRGSQHDVLDRYYQAAIVHAADAIVRITSDCPAIDACVVDEVVAGFLSGGYDSFCLGGEFPDGLDCQVFAFEALAKAWREATRPSEREHVGPYIEKTHPELFRNGVLHKFKGLAHHRWTLDEPRDYAFLCAVFERLHQPGQIFLAEHVLALLEREPQLLDLNAHIARNEGYQKSLAAERAEHVQT